MKNLKKIILTIIVMCYSTILIAQGTPGLEFTPHPDNPSELQVARGSASFNVQHIIIPDTFEGKPVTRIRALGFRFSSVMTNITLPKSLTSIGSHAFNGCTGLRSITLPNGLIYIEISAFEGCTGLTSIAIPNSVTVIRGSVFAGCTSLHSITFPNSLIHIGSEAFRGCTSLRRIELPNSLLRIDSNAFQDCTGLTNITLPNNLIEIGLWAFSGCTGLTSFTIPSSITRIGSNPFRGCINITNITVQAENTFYRVEGNSLIRNRDNTLISGFSNSVIPNTVTTVGSSAFSGQTRLTSIAIPNSVTRIESSAFRGCRGLLNIMIPISVNIIQWEAFHSCTSLTIYAEAPSQPPGWNWDWNPHNRPVVWGHVSNDDVVASVYVSSLLGNYPNPFNPETTIQFSIGDVGNVMINVYNVRGQRVRTLVNEQKEPGHHSVVWNGRDDGRMVSGGVYFYKMTTGEYQSVRRMVLMK